MTLFQKSAFLNTEVDIEVGNAQFQKLFLRYTALRKTVKFPIYKLRPDKRSYSVCCYFCEIIIEIP